MRLNRGRRDDLASCNSQGQAAWTSESILCLSLQFVQAGPTMKGRSMSTKDDKLRELQRAFSEGAIRFEAEVVLCVGHFDAFPDGFDSATQTINWSPDLSSDRIIDSHFLCGRPGGPSELLLWFGDTESRDIFRPLAKRAMTLVDEYTCPAGYEDLARTSPHFAWARWLFGQAEALNKPFEQCAVRWAKRFKTKGKWTKATSISTEWKNRRSDIPKARSVTADIEKRMADLREHYTGARAKPTRVTPKHREANRARKELGIVIARMPVFDWSEDATDPTHLVRAAANGDRAADDAVHRSDEKGDLRKRPRNKYAKVTRVIATMSDGTDEKRGLEMLLKHKGSMRYVDFLTEIGYLSKWDRSGATRSFGSLKTRLNAKLSDSDWLFCRKSHEVVLEPQKRKAKSIKKKSRKSNSS